MSNRKNAFTLVELLVVVGIIALLIGLLFTSLGEFRRQAMQTACLSNQRQISLAAAAYASDNAGRLPSPRTNHKGVITGNYILNPWIDSAAPGGWLAGNETLAALQAGVLWTYLGQNPDVYRSPQDPRDTVKNIRSYSLNGFVGVGARNYLYRADEQWDFPHPEHPATPPELRKQWYKTVTLAQIPQPSRTMYSITEDSRAIHLPPDNSGQGWVIGIHPSYDVPQFGVWIDPPALWNAPRVNMSYMDGSVEAADILYPSLVRQFEGDNDRHWVVEGGSRPAFKWMADRMLPGIIKQSLQ